MNEKRLVTDVNKTKGDETINYVRHIIEYTDEFLNEIENFTGVLMRK